VATTSLGANLSQISEDALQVGLETGFPIPEIHAEVIKAAEPRERRRTVDKLRIMLPSESPGLTGLAVEVRRQAWPF